MVEINNKNKKSRILKLINRGKSYNSKAFFVIGTVTNLKKNNSYFYITF